MSIVVIPDGGEVPKDPSDVKVYAYDWDLENLAPTVTIATSTWTITPLNSPAAWDAAVAYIMGDEVLSGGTIYVCLLAHTNQVPPNATYWAVVIADTPLTKDSEVRLTGVQATAVVQQITPTRTVTLDNRMTQVRLSAGTLGQTYDIANKVVTSETPSQTKERSFRVVIEQL